MRLIIPLTALLAPLGCADMPPESADSGPADRAEPSSGLPGPVAADISLEEAREIGRSYEAMRDLLEGAGGADAELASRVEEGLREALAGRGAGLPSPLPDEQTLADWRESQSVPVQDGSGISIPYGDDYLADGGEAPPFATFGPWGSTEVTWCLDDNLSGDLSGAEQFFAMSYAFGTWSGVSALELVREDCSAGPNIRAGFHTGYHWDWSWAGDFSSFDGTGGVLAHAFAPSLGYLHFDDDETWTRSLRTGTVAQPIDLDTVALHEAGHALGLDHSTVGSSVMDGGYGGSLRDLDPDDVAGMQFLYGPPYEACYQSVLDAYDSYLSAYYAWVDARTDSLNGVAGAAAVEEDAYYTYYYAYYTYYYAFYASFYGETGYGWSASWLAQAAIGMAEDAGGGAWGYRSGSNRGEDVLAGEVDTHYALWATIPAAEACASGGW